MPFEKGKKKTGGRKTGSINKTTKEAKEVIAMVAEGLGGADGLLEWAQSDKKNEGVFWSMIYPKLLPLTVAGDKDAPLSIEIVRTIVTRKV